MGYTDNEGVEIDDIPGNNDKVLLRECLRLARKVSLDLALAEECVDGTLDVSRAEMVTNTAKAQLMCSLLLTCLEIWQDGCEPVFEDGLVTRAVPKEHIFIPPFVEKGW